MERSERPGCGEDKAPRKDKIPPRHGCCIPRAISAEFAHSLCPHRRTKVISNKFHVVSTVFILFLAASPVLAQKPEPSMPPDSTVYTRKAFADDLTPGG